MNDIVLFQMWEPHRQMLIASHLFYVEQARKRLLSQFVNIEQEADKAAEAHLEKMSHKFDPDRHDPADFYEAANDEALAFYQLLTEMRQRTMLSIVAGIYQEWDKQLREWLVREICHWHRGEETAKKVWSVDFVNLIELLELLGCKIRSNSYFQKLDACRLVVNVYKHGEGSSLKDLKSFYPEYLSNSLANIDEYFSNSEFVEHSDLDVSEDQLQEFSVAIVEFWKDVPTNILNNDRVSIPTWFEKAMLKDRNSRGLKE